MRQKEKKTDASSDTFILIIYKLILNTKGKRSIGFGAGRISGVLNGKCTRLESADVDTEHKTDRTPERWQALRRET